MHGQAVSTTMRIRARWHATIVRRGCSSSDGDGVRFRCTPAHRARARAVSAFRADRVVQRARVAGMHCSRAGVGQLTVGCVVRTSVGDGAHPGPRAMVHAGHPASFDQRRADGGLLLPGRPGDQAGNAGRGARLGSARCTAHCRCPGRHDRAGTVVCDAQRRNARRAWLGYPHGYRYCVCARRSGTAG
jgi:hypothetical protein